jgi:hypothetical protein
VLDTFSVVELGTGCPMRKDAIKTATTTVMDGALASTSGALLRMWVGRQGAKISDIGGLQRMGGAIRRIKYIASMDLITCFIATSAV